MSPELLMFPCCESPPGSGQLLLRVLGGRLFLFKGESSLPHTAVTVPPCLAVPPLLVIYKDEGFAIAGSSPNSPPPSSWGLSFAIRR